MFWINSGHASSHDGSQERGLRKWQEWWVKCAPSEREGDEWSCVFCWNKHFLNLNIHCLFQPQPEHLICHHAAPKQRKPASSCPDRTQDRFSLDYGDRREAAKSGSRSSSYLVPLCSAKALSPPRGLSQPPGRTRQGLSVGLLLPRGHSLRRGHCLLGLKAVWRVQDPGHHTWRDSHAASTHRPQWKQKWGCGSRPHRMC